MFYMAKSDANIFIISLQYLRIKVMEKDVLIKKTIDTIQRLPDSKVQEVNDFAEFLLNKIDDQMITEGIKKISATSKSFDFLQDEPDLYSKADLKVQYK
jgi:hypothetical protein